MVDVPLRSRGEREILLEDDAAQQGILLELFSDEGCEVEVCDTLDEIYSALQQHHALL